MRTISRNKERRQMSSAEAAHRRTGTAAGVLELPPAYWSCRRRIGAAAGVLELPPAY